MYKATHFLLPSYFGGMFTLNCDVHNYETRHKNNLHLSQHRLNARTHSMRIHGVKLWNSLATELRSVPTYSIFKTQFFKSLFVE